MRDCEWATAWEREHGIVALTSFSKPNRKGRQIAISGYAVNDKYFFYPLWSRDGYACTQISVTDYNALIANARIIADDLAPVPSSLLRKLDTDIRKHLTL